MSNFFHKSFAVSATAGLLGFDLDQREVAILSRRWKLTCDPSNACKSIPVSVSTCVSANELVHKKGWQKVRPCDKSHQGEAAAQLLHGFWRHRDEEARAVHDLCRRQGGHVGSQVVCLAPGNAPCQQSFIHQPTFFILIMKQPTQPLTKHWSSGLPGWLHPKLLDPSLHVPCSCLRH